MNIIELYENSGIYRENLKEFTFDDVVKVQKQFDVERSKNPNVNLALQQNLISAINEFPNELMFISNNRILYNFFAKTNYSRNRFSSDNHVSVGVETVKSFIQSFLSEEIDSFFDKKIEENRFDEIDDFLAVKEYLPQGSLDKLKEKLLQKCDFVLQKLEENPTEIQVMSINFIKHRSFYDLLTHFSSVAIDEKVKLIYAKITSTLVSYNIKAEFLNPMMIAMGNYKAIDVDFATTIKFNKDQTIANTQKTSSSSSSGLSIGGMIAIAIIIIRLILLMVRCSNT